VRRFDHSFVWTVKIDQVTSGAGTRKKYGRVIENRYSEGNSSGGSGEEAV
jgi:hypothetical protein